MKNLKHMVYVWFILGLLVYIIDIFKSKEYLQKNEKANKENNSFNKRKYIKLSGLGEHF